MHSNDSFCFLFLSCLDIFLTIEKYYELYIHILKILSDANHWFYNYVYYVFLSCYLNALLGCNIDPKIHPATPLIGNLLRSEISCSYTIKIGHFSLFSMVFPNMRKNCPKNRVKTLKFVVNNTFIKLILVIYS